MNHLDMSQMMGLMYPNGQPAGAPQMQMQMQKIEAAEPTDPFEPVLFSPSQKYINEGLEQERTLTGEDIASIAAAHKRAVERGVLSPQLAEHLLPMAMVEGWGSALGVRTGGKVEIDPDVGFYASQRFKHSLSEMGLEEGKDYFTYQAKDKTNKMQNYIQPLQGSAAMSAAILGEKSKLKVAGGTLEGALKAYNGKGKATEYVLGDPVPADTKKYLAKVLEAKRLLAHEANAKIRNYYGREFSK